MSMLKEKYQQNTDRLRACYPEVNTISQYGADSPRLWNRNLSHDDFLFVRLGIGKLPFQVPIEVAKSKFNLAEDPLEGKPLEIKKNFAMLKDVPVGIDLQLNRHVGVFGAGSLDGSVEVAKSIIVQIAASNCYTDVKMVFLYDPQWEKELGFVKWLPHVWSEDKKVRFVATNKSQASDVLYALGNVFRIRSDEEHKKEIKPYYIVFVFAPEYLDGEPTAKYLIEDHDGLGASALFFSGSYEALPNHCTYLIENSQFFKGCYNVTTMDSQKTAVRFDTINAYEAEKFARRISGIWVNETESGSGIVNSLTFFDMHGVKTLAQLDAPDRWRKNRTYENMKALVGQRAGGAELNLDVHEKYHGPHGLVAGTTGSGKSETLQTYILSLALNFSPQDVAFLIIDYKGGGMANLFTQLPHMCGQISNLSGNQVHRAMVSIKSEIKRRQRIFGEYDVNHLDMYTRLLKNGEATLPIPHLIIIIDEFAELKREEPDFMRELISVAQVGRSLGIHLILATQKPSGTVDDNIWSNSKFRLCLRVQDRQDSMDMLKRPDAAYITQAGRCYLQVGNDEIFELFQSGWSGAVYDEDVIMTPANIATMLTLTGQPALIGSRSSLERKEKKRLMWIAAINKTLNTALIRLNKKPDARLIGQEEMQPLVDTLFALLNEQGFDYPMSRYNIGRIEEFIALRAALEPAQSIESITDRLYKKAVLNGIKLPELKDKTQLAAVIEYLAETAAQTNMQSKLTLWLPVLPKLLALSELDDFKAYFDGEGWHDASSVFRLDAIVGLVDDPVNQVQAPLHINYADDGHVAVCGMVVSGKSTFLQTLVYSLVMTYSPAAFNVYILDYSSRLLECFSGAPHCGSVVLDDQPERTRKFFTMITKELERRKRLFKSTTGHILQTEE